MRNFCQVIHWNLVFDSPQDLRVKRGASKTICGELDRVGRLPVGSAIVNDRKQDALDYIQRQIQDLTTIHQQALNALNAVQGKNRVQIWKKRVVGEIAEKVSPKHGKQFAKDWLETSYFVGDLFEELSDEVEMCQRHLKKLAKEIQTDGLPTE